MRKKIALFVVFLMYQISTLQAQSEFVRSLNDIRDKWMRPAYPIVAGIIFIGGSLFNMGHFFGESRDIKKGFTNILTYLGAALLVIAVFDTIVSMAM